MDLNHDTLSRLKRRLKDCFLDDETLRVFVDDGYFWSGQGFRGQLSIEAGNCFGVQEDHLLEIALFTELLHNASLVHDDIVDSDYERRGYQTLWHRYGLSKALLIGDLLIAKAFEVASMSEISSNVKSKWSLSLSNTVSVAVRGALSELDFKLSESDDLFSKYFRMASDKTGMMFTLPIRCIGYAAQLNESEIEKLSEIFSKLAVAYQIRDDEADYLGNKTGRATKSDFHNDRPNLFQLLSKSPLYSSNFLIHAAKYQEKLIEEAKVGLKEFPNSLNNMTSNLVLPFVQLSSKPDLSANLTH